MKITEKPTNYLMILAGSDHPMDGTDFLLVRFDEDWRQTMLKRLSLSLSLSEDQLFDSIAYADKPIGFISSNDEGDYNLIKQSTLYWSFVEIDEAEIKELEPYDSPEIYVHVKRNGKVIYEARIDDLKYSTCEIDLISVCKDPIEKK